MNTVAKAVYAFFSSAAAAAGTIYQDGAVEQGEVVVAVLGVLAITAGVWAIPNKEA